MKKVSRRRFLQVSGLAAGATMLPMPLKWLGSGNAQAFYQSPGIPLYGTALRLAEIPIALPNPLAGEWAQNETATATLPGMGNVTFPYGFPQTGIPSSLIPGQNGAPVTGVRHYTLTAKQFQDPGVAPLLGPTTLWGYAPDLTLLEGLSALGAVVPGNPFYINFPTQRQPARQLGGIIIAEAGSAGQPVQITMKNNLPLKSIIPNDLTVPGANLGDDRTTVHFHGGLMPWISDGGPFDWFCSAQRSAANQKTGESFLNNQVLNPAQANNKTQGEFYWNINKQYARFGWYHDHAWGITRINAYAGIATGLIMRDNFERSLVPMGLPPLVENSVLDGVLGSNPGSTPTAGYWPVREFPLVIQDKIFVGKDIALKDPTWPGPKTPGSLWYPHTYERNRWRRGASVRTLPVQSVIAEMFGDTILVNGTASPFLEVEPRRYRFRFLNAPNARFVNLQLYLSNGTKTGITLDANGFPTNAPFINKATGNPSWMVIGNEGGFFANVQEVAANKPMDPANFPWSDPATCSLLVGSAERPDVIVDFGNYPVGTEIIMYNDCPAPFPGGDPRNDYFPGLANGNTVNIGADPVLGHNTRCMMKFKIVTGTNNMNPDVPLQLTPGLDLIAQAAANGQTWSDPRLITPVVDQGGSAAANYNITTDVNGDWTSINGVTINKFKKMSLNELFDAYGRLEQRVGPLSSSPDGLEYIAAPVPEDIVNNGDVEVWAVYNTTADVHPMHWHMSNWQVIGRQPFAGVAPNLFPTGTLRGCLPVETGWKETVKCWPGEIMYMITKWDIPQITGPATAPFDPPTSPRPGLQGYHETVWHCHILEHEEHDMMRPLLINIPPR